MQLGLRFYISHLFCLIFTTACVPEPDGVSITDTYNWDEHVPFSTNYIPFSLPFSDAFNPTPLELGQVDIKEASGLGWSIKNPGMLWAHNDSGNTNMLFLIDATNGNILTRYVVSNTVNLDWEDIEISYGPEEGETYIYLADTGDNNERRPDYSIYRFVEPVYDPVAHFGKTIVLNIEVDRLRFTYPDGSHDTEGILVDPLTKDIFLVTKRDLVSMLFVAPFPQKINSIFRVYKAGEFSFRETSAATSSMDGERVLIKNRQEIFYWKRNENESMVEMLSRTPMKAPYLGEPQGEAICFDLDNNYFTLSEALNNNTIPSLYKYLIHLN